MRKRNMLSFLHDIRLLGGTHKLLLLKMISFLEYYSNYSCLNSIDISLLFMPQWMQFICKQKISSSIQFIAFYLYFWEKIISAYMRTHVTDEEFGVIFSCLDFDCKGTKFCYLHVKENHIIIKFIWIYIKFG